MFNGVAYASCDMLLSISKQTKLINKLVLENEGVGYEDLDVNEYYPQDGSKKYPNKKPILISYVPHGINDEEFFPINESYPDYKDYTEYKKNIFGGEEKDFVLFFNSRNIRRKQIPDALFAFKIFLDSLPKEKAEKCAFILHTEIVFEHGTDLMAVKDMLFGDYPNAIYFSPHKLNEKEMNYLYNIADAQILLSNNEGWGLSLTEAILSGTPIIANVTGGMQDQMGFIDDNEEWYENSPEVPSNHTARYTEHGEWAFPVYPTNRSIQGSVVTPYIWDDRCNAEDAAERIKEVYHLTDEERKEKGLKGREWAMSEKVGFTNKIMGERALRLSLSLELRRTPTLLY
jgi:glycosyltransferase involved in cell wall biosynthesis